MEQTIESTTTSTPSMSTSEVASLIGEDLSRVSSETVDWSIFGRGGVLVSLTIGLCDYGAKMGPADWGINMDPNDTEAVALKNAMERTVNFGSRYLLPKEWIRSVQKIQSDGRQALLDASFRVSDQARSVRYFVPLKRYAAWRATNDNLREQFEAQRSVLTERWDEFQGQMEADYRTVVRAQYRALVAQGVTLTGTADEYAEAALEASRKRVQTKEQAIASFVWAWDVKVVTFANIPDLSGMPSALKQDLKRSGALEANKELTQFVADLKGEVRSRVFDVVVGMLSAMKKRDGRITQVNVKQLAELTSWIEEMQFWPDAELDARLATLRDLVGQAGETRSTAQLEGALQTLGVETRSYLLEIGRPVKRSGVEVGIPDERRALAAARRRKPQTLTIEPIAASSVVDAPVRRSGRKSRAAAPIADAAPSAPSAPDAANVAA